MMIRADELPHRKLKDFGFEELPFKRFVPNSAVYYCMLTSFFLFETYKEDVLTEVIPTSPTRPNGFIRAGKAVLAGRKLCYDIDKEGTGFCSKGDKNKKRNIL